MSHPKYPLVQWALSRAVNQVSGHGRSEIEHTDADTVIQ